MRTRAFVVSFVALILGSVIAIFGAGPAVFADGPAGERVATFAVSAVVYLLIGAAAGGVAPDAWKWAGLCLAAPVVPVVLLLSDAWSDPRTVMVAGGFILGGFAVSLAGALAGSSIRGWVARR